MELVGDIRPDAHVQVLCDPFEGNGRFRSEPSGDMDFAHIAFGLAGQFCFGPAQLVELFAKDATSLCLGGFTSNLGMVVLPGTTVSLLEQIL